VIREAGDATDAGVIRDAGDAGLLLELEPVIDPRVNARAIAIASAVRATGIAGVRDVVSTFRSVAVYFDPLATDIRALRDSLEQAAASAGEVGRGKQIEVPVAYGGESGPDLGEVAAFAGLTPAQVIARHAAADYRVYMLGFLPGFAYMGVVAPEIAAPRRAAPRLRVPAGSVGIAGPQTAVYPRDSPGGWQIIGRTAIEVFDPARTPPALFAPGDSVRVVPDSSSVRLKPDTTYPSHSSYPSHPSYVVSGFSRTITVLRPGLFTTIQDSGRWGQQGIGVPVGGAMDLVSHRMANALVGNARDAAALEATLLGPELRIEQDTTIAISGADLSATIDGAHVALDTATRCRSGAVLRFGDRRHGARAYVAFDGGITMHGSPDGRARPLVAGKPFSLGPSMPARRSTTLHVAPHPNVGVRVRVLPGPQQDFFTQAAFDTLERCRYTVSTQSNRMGYRLQGEPIPRGGDREMISDATFPGAIQIPASGAPILLMADRQTTGGYPQIAVVITADLPRAAQLAPGDWIEFELCSHAEAVAALVAQEGKLLALG
jgi:antagonist of KipI